MADHEAVVRQLRADVDTIANAHDVGTSDFLTGLMEQHKKMAWVHCSMTSQLDQLARCRAGLALME